MSSSPPCPLYMECDEDFLSTAQMSHSHKKISALNKQFKFLESLARSSSSVSYSSEGVVIRLPEEGVVQQSPPPPPPPGEAVLSNPGYRLIMDPKTGRILGTIDSAGGRNLSGGEGPHPTARQGHMSSQSRPTVPSPMSQLPGKVPPLRPKARPSSTLVDLTRNNPPPEKPKPSPLIHALLVIPRVSKSFPAFQTLAKRSELDSRVKSLLLHPPAKFTEWLLQEGLIPSEQWETDPINGNKIKLKLGMYSDGKKYPSSGGYVWINESKTNKVISVFSGSIFMASNHAPPLILKLMYHWSCQTNVNNVMQWVKVNQSVLNVYYKLFRAVCSIHVNHTLLNLGGGEHAVEIGVISLGTTSPESSKREVKVEVLGILDVERGVVRLRASEPALGVTQAERFSRIFEPLPNWIQKSSRIITDLSVDEEQLYRLGYKSVVQCSVNAPKHAENISTNASVMDFLKKTVPKMFQNNLSYLTIPEIQQFLDELTFREVHPHPLAAFEGIIKQLSKVTLGSRSSPMGLVSYLQKVTAHPFSPTIIRSIEFDNKTIALYKKRSTPSADEIDAFVAKRIKVSSELVKLEKYFYGILRGDSKSYKDASHSGFKCPICSELFVYNLDFMKHLLTHVEKMPVSPDEEPQGSFNCIYCLRGFADEASLKEHEESAHLCHRVNNNNRLMCRICGESFLLKNLLIHHMTKFHVRSELPYACHLCGFRSSFHMDVVNHFHESHGHSDKLQCPRCLRVFILTKNHVYIPGGASAFISHLTSHEEKKGFPCKSCTLSFIQNDSLRLHVIRHHASYSGFEGLESYNYKEDEEYISMPRPDERLARSAPKRVGGVSPRPRTNSFSAQNLENLLMYNVQGENCGECGRRMTHPGHFTSYQCCSKCRYSTCCTRAMSQHFNLFHVVSEPTYKLGEPCILQKEMFCVCGFSAVSGNKMAKHLGSQGCKSAYPNKETAIKAIKTTSYPSLHEVRPSEGGIKIRIQKVSEKGPLAFLGLQRKPPSVLEPSEKTDPPEVTPPTLVPLLEKTSLQQKENDGEFTAQELSDTQ